MSYRLSKTSSGLTDFLNSQGLTASRTLRYESKLTTPQHAAGYREFSEAGGRLASLIERETLDLAKFHTRSQNSTTIQTGFILALSSGFWLLDTLKFEDLP